MSIRSHPAGLRLLGYALQGQGQSDEAVRLYEQALELVEQRPAAQSTQAFRGGIKAALQRLAESRHSPRSP